jgi:hypothetical protein
MKKKTVIEIYFRNKKIIIIIINVSLSTNSEKSWLLSPTP